MPLLLISGAIVGLLWVIVAMRILLHLWRRGSAISGSFVPGPLTFLRAISSWRRDPAERLWRRALLLSTLGVVGLSFATYANV